MSDSQNEFDRKYQRNAKKLDKLSEELGQVDLTSLSEQVRGVSCPQSSTQPGKHPVSSDLWWRS